MMISKLSLPRRTVLKGLGASLALPLLDAMVPAFVPALKGAASDTSASVQHAARKKSLNSSPAPKCPSSSERRMNEPKCK